MATRRGAKTLQQATMAAAWSFNKRFRFSWFLETEICHRHWSFRVAAARLAASTTLAMGTESETKTETETSRIGRIGRIELIGRIRCVQQLFGAFGQTCGRHVDSPLLPLDAMPSAAFGRRRSCSPLLALPLYRIEPVNVAFSQAFYSTNLEF